MEVVCGEVVVADDPFQVVKRVGLIAFGQLDQCQGVVEMVKGDDVLVEDVEHVGRIVLFLRDILDGDVLEVAYGIEGGVSVDPAILFPFPLHGETGQKIVKGMLRAVVVADGMRVVRAVRVSCRGSAMPQGDAGYRIQGDEGAAVVVAVVIGAFHQRALRIEVTHFQVGTDRRVKVAEDLSYGCGVAECVHKFWLFG